jgi:RNA-directed DNA polymerase
VGSKVRGLPVFFPFRYADDFVILVSGTREEAEHEKVELANYLHQTTGLELSEERTRISDLTEGSSSPVTGCATSGIRSSA